MNNLARLLSLSATLLVTALAGQAQTTVYDNANTTSATAGYGEANSGAPIFGDALTLTQSGKLSFFGLTLYNSDTSGSILTGSTVIKFYDNTVPYGGGSLATKPLLGTAIVNWNYVTDGGLPAGYYDLETFEQWRGTVWQPDCGKQPEHRLHQFKRHSRRSLYILGGSRQPVRLPC
jgi:hypothetical protein